MKQDRKTAPVRLFVGEDTFLMEEAIAALKDSLGGEALANCATYNGDETFRMEELVELCNTLPFLGEGRLIVLRNAHKLPAKVMPPLAAYIKDPLETTTLVLTVEGPLKKNDAFLKRLPSGVATTHFELLKGAELAAWIQKRTGRYGKAIEKDAAFLLAELTGGHTWFIASEIEKACLYVGARATVTRADIEYLVMKSPETSIFAFQDALFERRKEAFPRLIELEETGMEPLEVITMLANQTIDHYSILFGADWKGRPIHPFVARKIMGRKALWTPASLSALLADLRGIERAVKTGRTSMPFAALAEMLGRFVARKPSA